MDEFTCRFVYNKFPEDKTSLEYRNRELEYRIIKELQEIFLNNPNTIFCVQVGSIKEKEYDWLSNVCSLSFKITPIADLKYRESLIIALSHLNVINLELKNANWRLEDENFWLKGQLHKIQNKSSKELFSLAINKLIEEIKCLPIIINVLNVLKKKK